MRFIILIDYFGIHKVYIHGDFIEKSYEVYDKNEKYNSITPKIENELIQSVRMKKSTRLNLSLVLRYRSSGFPTRSDTNQAAQLQKVARGLKFRI